MKTCLYQGHVEHQRYGMKRHAFRYRVFSMLLDLDEAEALSKKSRIFGFNRSALLSFHEADHGTGSAHGLKEWVLAHLTSAGFQCDTTKVSVRVLCYPRIFGYVFNPLTVYYCYDEAGALMATLHEVHNTFNEKHTYVLPAAADESGRVRQISPKRMYVSPFTELAGQYQFALNLPDDELQLFIGLRQGGARVLSATFAGRRKAFSDAALFATFFLYPLMTFKVIAGIHFEALRIWLKGVKLVRHEAAPESIAASHQRVGDRLISEFDESACLNASLDKTQAGEWR